jgi:hypothetical protein
LLCLSQSFSPDTTPTAIRASKLAQKLSSRWDVAILTEARQVETGHSGQEGRVQVQVVPSRRPRRLFAALRRLRLNKLTELLVWPDESIFWAIPAVLAGRRLIRERRPEAIVVFMMPYSAGIAGVLLSRLTGVALVLNLDDSLTCTDMHPYFPTRLHYRLAGALEDFYVRTCDAIVYVSQRNLDAVRLRQSERVREKLHLVRYGADPSDFSPRPEHPEHSGRRERCEDPRANERTPEERTATDSPSANDDGCERFEVAYVGAMSGWWALIGDRAPASPIRRLYGAWTRLGRHERTTLDPRTSSPAVAGRAILDLLDERPGWAGRVRLMVYGNPYEPSVVARALKRGGVEEVVTVLGPTAHTDVAEIVRGADLLFLTLPNRLDGSPGGRISAKTYEYLMTDRPILAAVPPGENWDYLEGRPGVWLVRPDDRESMKAIIAELAQAKFAGQARTFDREPLREELSYETRAQQFENVIRVAIKQRAESAASAPPQ